MGLRQLFKGGTSYPVKGNDGYSQLYGVAAPLLAGFSLSLIGGLVTLPPHSEVRWRDMSLVILILAALMFLASMFFFINASHLRVSDEMLRSVGNSEDEVRLLRIAYRRAQIEDDLRAGFVFTLSCTILVAGVTVVMVPAGPWGQVSILRWLAIGIAGLATAVQLARNIIRLVGASGIRPVWLRELILPSTRLNRFIEEAREANP